MAKEYYNPDLHMHSVFSDGTDTPAELLTKVREAGIDLFALTDHDTFAGCIQMQGLLRDGDPAFISGVELTCRDGLGKYHILGYGFRTEDAAICHAVEMTHNVRLVKTKNRFRFLMEERGMYFTDEEIHTVLMNKNPGKPHIAALMLQKGYVKDRAQAFAVLSEYHGRESVLSPTEAIDAILHADGIPVLAHGILADGTKKLTKEEITARVERLKKTGLMGLECRYSSFTDEQRDIMLSLAKKNNLLITAGSDYHGKNKTVRLGETGNPLPEEMRRFYRMAVINNP